jgi:hypothetical protein
LHGVDEKWGKYKDLYIDKVKEDNPQYEAMTSKPLSKAQKQGAILEKTGNIPAGITATEWAAMSPEDKKLWAK